MTVSWSEVAACLEKIACDPARSWKFGQARSLRFLAGRVAQQTGALIADEVGLGKTRLALAFIEAVQANGGRVAAVVPPGLLYQWDKEWRDYQQRPGGEGVEGPLLLRGYADLFEAAGAPQFPVAKRGRWLLFSHTFGAPAVRSNSRPWRFYLASLVKAHLLELGEADRPRKTNLWRWVASANACWELEKPADHEQTECRWCIERAAAQYLAGRAAVRAHLKDLPRTMLESPEAARDHAAGEEGRKLTTLLMRELIGGLDLVVIDEAHKSRDDGDEPTKVLGRLLAELLPQGNDNRRLALTATPVELSADQWRTTLDRIGTRPRPDEEIDAFSKAHATAHRHPDQSAAIQELIASSGNFQAALRPHVTRRRRVHQEEMRTLLGAASELRAHAHRRLGHLAIDYEGIDEAWKPIVLALEGLGKAAKGAGVEGSRDRQRDLRYASGHLGRDLDGSERAGASSGSPAPAEPGDDALRGKRQRMAFWRRLIGEQLQGLSRGREVEELLLKHPRVVAVADHLERLLWSEAGADEKVLVFGVFLQPMKALRTVLNHRAALRLLDRGVPVPAAKAARDELEALWAEYEGVKERSAREGARVPPFSGALAVELADREELERLLASAGRRYESLRDGLQRHITEELLPELPGDAAISRLTKKSRRALAELLRARVLNEWLSNPADARLLGAGRDLALERGAEAPRRAKEIWAEILSCQIEVLDPDAEEEAETEFHVDEEIGEKKAAEWRELDRRGDHLSPKQLEHLIEDEYEGSGTRLSNFARLMSGEMPMERRRVLQAQFNTRAAFPRVLIAQSTVGREGLNLHTACRRVVLFHPEWNPAVVEQQIGRVDRIGSLWQERAEAWLKTGAAEEMPLIEVESVVFEGTYDEYQARVLEQRRRSLRAQLFGELLDESALERIPETLRERVRAASPDFSPPADDA